MAAPKNPSGSAKKLPPARSPEQRQNQLINMAMDYAEEQFRSGKATSQLATHFLKLATTKELKELRKLDVEYELAQARTKSIDSSDESVNLQKEVLRALGGYMGLEQELDPDDYPEY